LGRGDGRIGFRCAERDFCSKVGGSFAHHEHRGVAVGKLAHDAGPARDLSHDPFHRVARVPVRPRPFRCLSGLTVLYRLFVSGSDRAAERWRDDHRIEGVEALELHHLYRAMAFLRGVLLKAPSVLGSPRCVKDVIL
jgi:hypothetical protein